MVARIVTQASQVIVFGWIANTISLEETNAQTISGDPRRGLSENASLFFYQQSEYPRDCKDIIDQCSSSDISGVHLIKPEGYHEPFEVQCANGMDTGGWTVIQTRHKNGSIDFGRDWGSYKRGFGFLSQDYWLGNDRLSHLTNQGDYELLMKMTMSNGTVIWASYHHFRIGDEYSSYRLLSLSHNFIRNAHITWPTGDDCQDIYNSGSHDNGVYIINPLGWPGSPFEVYCNMSNGEGWTVFQRRVDGSVDFYRDWENYKEGFGDLADEFWLGNDQLFYLTNQKNYEIRIDFVGANGAPYFAEYSSFRINNETDNYRLSELGTFSGTAGTDSLSYHRGHQFSTSDRDNDVHSSNCAQRRRAAWWYHNCEYSCLNCNYGGSGESSIHWDGLPGGRYNIKYTEMKIRPV